MTSHVDEGMLLAYADGELSAGERAEVREHLEECAVCATELDGLRAAAGSLTGALGLLDRPAPAAVSPEQLRWRARRPAPARRGWAALPRAAVLVLGFAAAASATIPGSPVRRWVEGWVAEPAPRTAAVERPAASVVPAPAAPEVTTLAAAPEAGVTVATEGGAVAVVLSEAAPDLQVRAVLVDGARAGAFGSGEAAGARFGTGAGRIEVVGAGAGELRIEIPRGAASATVTVNGRPYLSKEGDQLRLTVPGTDSAAAEISFRVRS